MNQDVQIVPSVLPCDFARLGEAINALESAGVDKIQFDVMDGHFVPNLTFGADVIASLRPWTMLPFEAHLMIEAPELSFERYLEAGCELLIVHAESSRHLHRTLAAIGRTGAKVGIALNPSTSEEDIRYLLDLVDLVLVMTVNPGFGGQDYIASMEPKIAAVRALIEASGKPIDLEVDGGISTSTITGAAQAGANHFVAGSALFRDEQGLGHAVSELRRLAAQAPFGRGTSD
jgi:ribulose-phosphate 3-epimerase